MTIYYYCGDRVSSGMLTKMRTLTLVALCLTACSCLLQCATATESSFSTGGHTIYHLQAAVVAGNTRGIIAAAYDGAILSCTPQGQQLWRSQPSNDFPYDLCVADIDSDQRDEALVATAGGELHALDDDGSLLWSFTCPAPLFQVAAAQQADKAWIILTGGIDQQLYALSPQGKALGSLKTQHCIRHLRAGDMLGNGRDEVAMATTSSGLGGKLSLFLIDPTDLSVCWQQQNLGTHAHNSGKRFFSMEIADLDKDGHDDIVLSNSWGEHGRIFAFDHRGEQLFTTTDARIPNVSYRMNLLHHVALPNDEFILGHFGNVLIVYELDGSCREVLSGPYSFAGGAYDPVLHAFYFGSSVSGGDGVYALQLDQPGWQDRFKSWKPVGRLAEIERNVVTLERQIAAFDPPPYQSAPKPVTVLAYPPKNREYESLKFVRKYTWTQQVGERDELWCRDIDRRFRYDLTADAIVAKARQQEAAGQPFVVWSGHGHAVYFPLTTFRRIVEAAPKTLWGFEFAEMEGVDSDMQEVVEQILLPVAELCRDHGKKVIFRNKNIYWSGTCYVPFLKNVLLDARYHDVFLPALEETNCRTHEMSLAGRIGLWQAGSFDAWSCRMVTDNANWDRMWEYGGQQVPTHHLRHLVSRATLGARVFFNNIHQGPFTSTVYERLVPFYDMLDKGILQIPEKHELLSVSDVAIGMQSPPAPEFIEHGINGHHYLYPTQSHPEKVFDRLDCYWGGAPLLDHDASQYVYGVTRRQCNFLPPTPFGMVAIVPADAAGEAPTRFRQILKTDGRFWYDEQSKRQTASAYRDTVLQVLEAAGDRLPVRVLGSAHWSVSRLDANHVRVTLIDPGYLDPAEREVEIVLQYLQGTKCRDILAQEDLPMDSGRIRLRIPAATLRIVDIEHKATDR